MPAQPPSSPSPSNTGPRRRRPGRPPGSVSLTPEIQQRILTFIRAGAFAQVAAEAAGVSARTFHDWMARGRGEHPTRSPTPKLKAFAREVDRARAEARAAAEVRVFREHPKYWLSHVARSRPDAEGWTDLKGDAQGLQGDTFEDRLREVDHRMALEERDSHRASCTDPKCPSPLHQGRFDDDRNCIQPLDSQSWSD